MALVDDFPTPHSGTFIQQPKLNNRFVVTFTGDGEEFPILTQQVMAIDFTDITRTNVGEMIIEDDICNKAHLALQKYNDCLTKTIRINDLDGNEATVRSRTLTEVQLQNIFSSYDYTSERQALEFAITFSFAKCETELFVGEES